MASRSSAANPHLTPEDVRRVCGTIPQWKVAEILDTDADLQALEEAAAWASGDDETTPHRHLAPHSPAGRVYDILMAGEEAEDEEGAPPGAA